LLLAAVNSESNVVLYVSIVIARLGGMDAFAESQLVRQSEPEKPSDCEGSNVFEPLVEGDASGRYTGKPTQLYSGTSDFLSD